MIIAATGHRPDKVGGYSDSAGVRRRGIAEQRLIGWGPTKCIVGMALGWDTDVALVCIKLGIPFIAAVPFAGQESRWPEKSRRVFHAVLSHASEVVTVCEGGYAPHKMQVRNQWMVDHCDLLLALWDGSPGGTGNCIAYAQQKGVHINNCWEDFV